MSTESFSERESLGMVARTPPCGQQSPQRSEIRPGMLSLPAKSPATALCPHFGLSRADSSPQKTPANAFSIKKLGG